MSKIITCKSIYKLLLIRLNLKRRILKRQLEYLDNLLITARQQLDALLGNTTAVMTLARDLQTRLL